MNTELLDEMLSSPHLLIAGMTGSGKSVLLNQLISRMNPGKESGLICIDLKRVELIDWKEKSMAYADDVNGAVNLLTAVIEAIDRRYREMQKKRIKLWEGADIYVCIDELADLMVTCRKQVEPLLIRIGQIGRAARVHLVMATQQPSAKIIPTAIKLNCERVALHCMTAQQSRQVIEQSGAELLPRYGWCIWQGARREITL